MVAELSHFGPWGTGNSYFSLWGHFGVILGPICPQKCPGGVGRVWRPPGGWGSLGIFQNTKRGPNSSNLVGGTWFVLGIQIDRYDRLWGPLFWPRKKGCENGLTPKTKPPMLGHGCSGILMRAGILPIPFARKMGQTSSMCTCQNFSWSPP